MPRNLSPAVLAASQAPQKRIGFFVELVFATETVWVWTGLGSITAPSPAWDPAATFPYNQAFTGLGWLGTIASMPSTTEGSAQNMTLMLTGIVKRLLADVINATRLSGSVTVWLAFFDQQNNILPDPIGLWQGQTDVPSTTDDMGSSTISITVENALLALNLASNRRFTTLDQQLDFPGDAGFDYVTAMQDLYLPFPVSITVDHNVHSAGQAPNAANALTISPSGPQKLPLAGTLQVQGTAVFATGPLSQVGGGKGSYQVTAMGLWSTSDPGVAIVSNGTGGNLSNSDFGTGGGLITAVGPGNCTITFYFGQVSRSLTVSVA